jgi:hypothetical protein
MAALIIAAIAAIQEVSASEDHQAILEIEIEAFDKCLGLVR